jgi:hypothetical protein
VSEAEGGFVLLSSWLARRMRSRRQARSRVKPLLILFLVLLAVFDVLGS